MNHCHVYPRHSVTLAMLSGSNSEILVPSGSTEVEVHLRIYKLQVVSISGRLHIQSFVRSKQGSHILSNTDRVRFKRTSHVGRL